MGFFSKAYLICPFSLIKVSVLKKLAFAFMTVSVKTLRLLQPNPSETTPHSAKIVIFQYFFLPITLAAHQKQTSSRNGSKNSQGYYSSWRKCSQLERATRSLGHSHQLWMPKIIIPHILVEFMDGNHWIESWENNYKFNLYILYI